MDRYLKWEQLTLTQQLNCVCDMLAKKSITTAIIERLSQQAVSASPQQRCGSDNTGRQKLLVVSGLPCGSMQAKRWQGNIWQIAKMEKWSNKCFNRVDWEHLELALKNKAHMYRIWRSKHNSGFCSTRVLGGHYSGDLVPNK
jgi:hypothetical protein